MISDRSIGKMSVAQAVTASAASTDYIDLTAAGDAIGQDCYVVIQCNENAAASGAATVEFKIQTADDAAFTNPATIATSGPVGKAAVLANRIVAKLRLGVGWRRYMRIYYDVQTGPLTAGKFTSFIVTDLPIQ